MSAEIEPINASWGSTAAAADALQRCHNEAPFVAIWIDKEGGIKWSKANTDFSSLSMIAIVATEFAQACTREAIGTDK